MPPRHEHKKMHFPIIAPSSLRVVSRACASGRTMLRNSPLRHQFAATAQSAATLLPQPGCNSAAAAPPGRHSAAAAPPGCNSADAAPPSRASAAAAPLSQHHTAEGRLRHPPAAAAPLSCDTAPRQCRSPPYHHGAPALSCDAEDMRIATRVELEHSRTRNKRIRP